MKREVLECKRCCCCLPLRYGLLAWGYFKMTADAFMIAFIFYSLMLTVRAIVQINQNEPNDELLHRMYVELTIVVIFLAVFLTDFVVTIIFIVAGHKKNVKLIRVFYFNSIAMWIFSFLLSVTYTVLIIQNGLKSYWLRSMMGFSFYFLGLVVQTYFLILLRSEINKLQKIGKFRFVNNATKAECTMKSEEIVEREETGREDFDQEKTVNLKRYMYSAHNV